VSLFRPSFDSAIEGQGDAKREEWAFKQNWIEEAVCAQNNKAFYISYDLIHGLHSVYFPSVSFECTELAIHILWNYVSLTFPCGAASMFWGLGALLAQLGGAG